MKKYQRAILTFSILMLAAFITANAVDVNDISVFCNDGDVLKVIDGQWKCGTATATESDPIFISNNNSLAKIGDCPPGEVVQNTTTGGVECTEVTTATTAGDTIFRFKEDSGRVVFEMRVT